MKKIILTAMACLAFAVAGVAPAFADDASDIAAIKKQIADLQKQVADLEAKQAQPGAAANISFNGYVRGRLNAPEAENTGITISEMALNANWNASDKIHGFADLWFYPTNGFYLEAAGATFDEVGIGKGSKLMIGKNRNFTYGITPTGGNRLTSNYSLYSDAYHHDRVVGIQSLNKLDNGKIDLNIGILQGYRIGTRGVGLELTSGNSSADPTATGLSTQVLANRETATGGSTNMVIDSNNNRAVSARLGGNITKCLNVGISGYAARLSNEDGTALNTITGFTATKRRHIEYGLDFKLADAPWILQGEYTKSDIGGYKNDGFQVLAGYNFDAANMMYVQYGQIEYDTAAVATKSASWDKQQISVSFKHKLSKMSWLQLEHEFNQEDPPAGTAKVDNDITFLEWFVGF